MYRAMLVETEWGEKNKKNKKKKNETRG